jgi:hypothetical protein
MGPVGYENKFDLSLGPFYKKYIDFEKLISNKKYIVSYFRSYFQKSIVCSSILSKASPIEFMVPENVWNIAK